MKKKFTKFIPLSLVLMCGSLVQAQTVSNTNVYNAITPLTGTVISDGAYASSSSWILGNINGPSVAGATNDTRSTYCILNSGSTSGSYFIGYDFSTPTTVGSVAIYPVNECLWLMQGVKVQGANVADFSDAVDLKTFDSTDFVPGQYNYFTLPAASSYQYVRILAPAAIHNTFDGNDYIGLYLNEFRFYGPDVTAAAEKLPYTNTSGANTGYLTGQITDVIGNTYYYSIQRTVGAGSKDNYPVNAFDDNGSTIVNGNKGSNPGFVFDFGTSTHVHSLGLIPRSSYAVRVQGIRFELSDNADFSTINGTFTIPATFTPTNSTTVYTYLDIPTDSSLYNATGRYIRVSKSSTASADFDFGELRFYATAQTTPVPVTFADFKVSAQGASAVLSWKSYTESNVSHYDIQASTNGQVFTTISAVKAKGTSAYVYTDASPLAAITYYRIVAVDNDGKTTISSTRSVSLQSGSSVVISPNPAHNVINIAGVDVASVIIYDYSGKAVLTKNDAGSGIDISTLKAGIYFVKIMAKDGTATTQKLLVK